MTKKQNRTRGFGKRLLSVVLTVVMILSTLVVMLTATSLSAGAAISYWNIAGNFNDWGNSLNNTSYRINGGSGGSVTIAMTASSIQFKACAYENGWKWCGNSSGSLSVDTEGLLEWDSGNNIETALPANTTSVTFTISVKDGKNYIKVHANTSGGGVTPTPSANTYTAKVNDNNSANSKDKIFWAEATYFDYLSDKEITNGWLNPDHVGTSNFNGNIDEWYPFYNFNRNVVKFKADSNSSWSKPLYFGNFCNTYNAYDTSHHPGVSNGYNDATGSSNVTRFNYAANNSNGVYDRNTSVQGLMGSTLKDGMLQTADGMIAPYFDQDSLGDYAKIVKSAFPFRKQEVNTGNGKYMRYEFDSTNAKDNVYFDWSGSTPTAVNYGAGTSYGVKDGIKEFMNTNSGYGIFPFNRTGTGNGGNNQLDYGFGIRMDMKFRVPTNTEVKFDFSGDDDLWMYITDTTDGTSQLVLDMGGSHKESEGEVNFTTKTSTVYKVDDPSASNKDIWIMDTSSWGNIVIWAWDNNGNGEWYYGDQSSNLYRFRDNLIGSNGNPLSSKTGFQFMKNTGRDGQTGDLSINDRAGKCSYTDNTSYTDTNHVTGGHCKTVSKSFDFNPKHTYTMTIFYMERGLIESNCKMGFTLTPLGNNFIVTEVIDTVNVNPGLQEIVRQLSQFGFSAYNNGSAVTDPEGSFDLGNGDRTDIGDTVLPMNSNVNINQYALQNSYLTYDTTWEYWDNESGTRLSYGSGVTSNGSTTETDAHTIINESGDEYDYAELQVNYRNTPQVGSFTLKKEMAAGASAPPGKTFPATIYLQFSSDQDPTPYTLHTSDGAVCSNGRIELEPDVTYTFNDVPVGTHVYVVEDADQNYTPSYSHTASNPYIVGNRSGIVVTNTPVKPKKITGSVSGTKKFDNSNYTGTLFSFKLDGVPRFAGDADNIIDTSSMTTKETTTVSDGVFTISGLEFEQPGVYRYHLYEDMDRLAAIDALHGNLTHYATDISNDATDCLVSITVTLNADNKLEMGAPVYYPYSGTHEGITSADFNPQAGQSSITFYNTAEKAYVEIEKTNQSGNPVSGVVFAVVAISDDIASQMSAMTDIEAYDFIKGKIAAGGVTVAATDFTDEDGYLKLDELPIYQTGYRTSSAPEYQKYCLIEYTGPSTYSINKTVYPEGSHSFSFPMEDSETHEWQYHCTFQYVNGKLRMPSTSGVGMMIFKTVGFGLAGLALISFGCYMIITKKRQKRKAVDLYVK